jgi:hypothetical protein
MATQDNLQALFGGTMLPEEMQQQLLNQRARDFATLTPAQQLGVMGYKAGAGLGSGLAQAMGVDITDPAIKRMSTLRALSQGVENTSEGMAQFAQKLRDAGFPTEAAQAMDKAREIAKTEAETTLKGAQAKKAENFQMANTASERNRKMISELEVKLAEDPNYTLTPKEEAELRWQIGQETKPRTTFDAESGKAITVEPINLEQAAPNINKYLSSKAAPGTTTSKVTTSQVTEPKLGEGVQKEIATVDEGIVKVGTAEAKIKTLAPSIDNLNLGLIANYEREGNAWLGLETADAKEFKKLRRAVAEQANNLLLLAKGTQTEGDAQRARDQIVDDNTWKNKELLKSAFADLQTTLADTQKALRVKRESLTSKGRAPAPANPASPDVAPNKSPMSGKNPEIQPPSETAPPKQLKEIPQDILDKANDAVKRGAKREDVVKRLRDQGYSVL